VIRVWELPVERVLGAGVSVLPSAPITAVGQNEVAAVIERMKRRLEGEVEETTATVLWTATKVLMGLRYEAGFVEPLLRGVRGMKESTTYQAIMEEGRQEERPAEARRVLLRVGEDRFGTGPTPEQRTILEAITDANRLEDLVVRACHVGSWAELLEQEPPPAAPPRRARRKKSP
jgi:hypothetical protein